MTGGVEAMFEDTRNPTLRTSSSRLTELSANSARINPNDSCFRDLGSELHSIQDWYLWERKGGTSISSVKVRRDATLTITPRPSSGD